MDGNGGHESLPFKFFKQCLHLLKMPSKRPDVKGAILCVCHITYRIENESDVFPQRGNLTVED